MNSKAWLDRWRERQARSYNAKAAKLNLEAAAMRKKAAEARRKRGGSLDDFAIQKRARKITDFIAMNSNNNISYMNNDTLGNIGNDAAKMYANRANKIVRLKKGMAAAKIQRAYRSYRARANSNPGYWDLFYPFMP